MDKTRVLVIKYDNKVSQSEIPLLRGAVIGSMEGNADIMYHNHNGKSLMYRYPLIQYKRIRQSAAIVAIDAGVDVIGQFISSGVTKLCLGSREEAFSIENINANKYIVQLWDAVFEYRLRKWLPLNSFNYAEYREKAALSDRILFLEKILVGNILSFAKGIGVTLDSHLDCKILSIERQTVETYKGVKMMAFDVEFRTNVTLPDFIGLGKGVSIGFGTVCRKYNDISKE